MTPTGLVRSRQASARPPATCSAVSYLLRASDDATIDADVSSRIHAGMRRCASYSLTCTLAERAVTRQSIDFTGSPGW